MTIKGVVFLIHGNAEHSGRYTHVVQALTDAGFQVTRYFPTVQAPEQVPGPLRDSVQASAAPKSS